MSEVCVGRSGGQHEVVVLQLAVGQHEPLVVRFDGGRGTQQHGDVFVRTKYLANRGCDVGRAQGCYGYLIQQWLKKMVVAAIDQRHACG